MLPEPHRQQTVFNSVLFPFYKPRIDLRLLHTDSKPHVNVSSNLLDHLQPSYNQAHISEDSKPSHDQNDSRLVLKRFIEYNRTGKI